MASDESAAVMTARQFREDLLRQEDAALREMARLWTNIEGELYNSILLLTQEINARKARGEIVSDQMIYNMDRYQQMLAQVQQELMKYETEASRVIAGYQVNSYTLGLEAARATIIDTQPSSPMWNLIGRDAAEVMAGFAGNGAPLAELLAHDYGDIWTFITDALVSGVGLGKGPDAVARQIRDLIGKDEYVRASRIARTEINRAYRIASADQYAKSGVVEKVLRLCAKQPNTCLACLLMDGEEVKGGFVVDDHPNGRCTTIAVTIGGNYPEWQKGASWFEEQDEKTQRAIMGDGRYEMWKKDGVNPRSMVEIVPNPVWGGSPTVIPEYELKSLLSQGLLATKSFSVSVPWESSEILASVKNFADSKKELLAMEGGSFVGGKAAEIWSITQNVFGLNNDSIKYAREIIPDIQKAFDDKVEQIGKQLYGQDELTKKDLRRAKNEIIKFLDFGRPSEAIREVFFKHGIEVIETQIDASPEWIARLLELGEPITKFIFRRMI